VLGGGCFDVGLGRDFFFGFGLSTLTLSTLFSISATTKLKLFRKQEANYIINEQHPLNSPTLRHGNVNEQFSAG
jgi:hypothetical protein